VGPLLHDFATAADREADGEKGYRWSYRRDFGPVRVVVVDSRCGRILDSDDRAMVGPSEAAWIESQVDGEMDHLLVVTSLPWLLPRAVHDLESWDEALCDGSRGPRLGRFGEKLREGADLEHWAAFRKSFDWLAGLLERVARSGDGHRPPATVCVLSGDVHHQYVARAHWPEPVDSNVYQVVVSPVHHTVPISQRMVFKLGWSRLLEKLTTTLGRWDKVPPLPLSWSKIAGPFFGNALGMLVLDGRSATFSLQRAVGASHQEDRLEPVTGFPLS